MPNSRRHSAQRTHNPSGVHFLSSPRIANAIVRNSGVDSGDLVVEFGPGLGALTAPLARTGATVLAVERDEQFVRRLSTRFAGCGDVRVIHDDARRFPLPRKAFNVVSNIPFAVSSPVLRRLLDPAGGTMRGADLLVEWGLAKRLTAHIPRSAELAWWNARFSIELRRKVPATVFTPAPNVDAAHLEIRRNPQLTRMHLKALWTILDAAYQRPGHPVGQLLTRFVPGRHARRLLADTGPRTPAGELRPAHWATLARQLADTAAIRWPELPRRLRGR